MPDQASPETIRAGLLRTKYRSLRGWCRKYNVNYNTAWAAMHGVRSGHISAPLRERIKKAANV